MIIINADDWGGWKSATDAARQCFERGRLTSATAMVFMEDSVRAAEIGQRLGIDLGLHVNFTKAFSAVDCPVELIEAQARLRRFLKRSKLSLLLYHPLLRDAFRKVYGAQVCEFKRLYGKPPSHIDGHQHMHLCTNMLIDQIIAPGECVRRSFSFWPGEKGWLNRYYRALVNKRLAGRYCVTDYFFSLRQCLQGNRFERVVHLAKSATLELMTHPQESEEFSFLMGNGFRSAMEDVHKGTYSTMVSNRECARLCDKEALC